MTEETKTYVFNPDNNNSNVPAWMAMNNGGLFGNNGWGGGIIGFILGILLGNGGLFNGGLNNNFGGMGYIANQLNNDSGRELIMQAINGNRDAIGSLAATLNTDFNSVQNALMTISSGIQNVGSQVGMSGLEVINSIQRGNADLASQLYQCCCENRLLTTEQGYQAQIRTIEQTNQLGSQSDRNTASIVGAINSLQTNMTKEFCDVKEREMQAKIDTQAELITQLRNAENNAAQTAQIAAMIAPMQSKLIEIENRQPNTVPVVYPNISAVNNTPYNGWNNSFNGWGYGVNGGSYWG